MLLLFETPAGYSVFKVSNEKKISKASPDEIHEKFFGNVDKAKKNLELVEFKPFGDTADAVTAATSCIEGKLSSSLSSFLKKQFKNNKSDSLAVADKNLAISIKDKYENWDVIHNPKTAELFRGIRCYIDDYLSSSVKSGDIRSMQLGLSHSLSRYKLKFSADKVDTMVIQAIGLLDELDKEINTYAMRVKEWYGWHFPEMQRLVPDNVLYAKVVMKCGFRSNIPTIDLSSILEEETMETSLKEAVKVSMGTEISDIDVIHIQSLAEQVVSLTQYRTQLFEYLKNRMNAIAPNLTILVGEIVGARLISHAGSLMNLAKFPASTIQILGAEKALFRALKTKHDTPKYGLIFHASLVGSAIPKNKGKISRMLAAKSALAVRVDALTDVTLDDGSMDTTIGLEGRSKVEMRLRLLQFSGSSPHKASITSKKTAKYTPTLAKSGTKSYDESKDMVLEENDKKRKEHGSDQSDDKAAKKAKKLKKEKRKSKESSENDKTDKELKKAAKKIKKEKRKSKES